MRPVIKDKAGRKVVKDSGDHNKKDGRIRTQAQGAAPAG
jgi:hypothetical protein